MPDFASVVPALVQVPASLALDDGDEDEDDEDDGRQTNGSMNDAHAWVELNGRVLNDTQDVHTRFTPFASTSGPQ